MAEDFIIDDYGGGFYNGGGGGDYYGSGAGDDFYYGYGSDQPSAAPDLPFFQGPVWWSVPLEPPLDPVADQAFLNDPGAGALSFDQLFWEWMGLGLNPDDAAHFAQLDLEAAAPGDLIRLVSAEEGSTPSPVQLPDIGPLPPFPYTPFDPWQTPPIIPELEIYFPLPPPPPPAPTTPKLPPACKGGTYHPYPIGHPQQDICVPFPPAPKPPAQQSKPPAQSQSPASKPPTQQQSKPPTQQQQCPTGQWRNPQTGRCEPIPKCTTPGTVFDQRSGRCVPFAQAQQPGCPPGQWPNPQTRRCEPIPKCTTPGTVFDPNTGQCVPKSQLGGEESIFDGLGKLPWWVWALLAGVGVVALSDRGDQKTTTRRR